MERGRKFTKESMNLQSEKGYLMLSTLYLLILTGIFSQSIIKTSANYIIQLNQISSAYQTKVAVNMTERILKDYIVENNYELPETGKISSSIGNIEVMKITDEEYEVIITQRNGNKVNEKIKIENYKNEEDDKLDFDDVYNETETNIIDNPEMLKDILENK